MNEDFPELFNVNKYKPISFPCFSLTGVMPFYAKDYNQILIKNKKCKISFEFEFLNVRISKDGKESF